jgi:MFS transporter, SHS family, sialic acid transporter
MWSRMTDSSSTITSRRYFVVTCAILAWLCSGIIMAIPPLVTQTAVKSMGVTDGAIQGRWFSWHVCAFLLGGAVGGFLFGWMGDRWGRVKALGLSVLTYSLIAGACYFCRTPWQLIILWFLASTGVGGVWPNGVSLAVESLPGTSKSLISGLFGTAANLGLMLLAALVMASPVKEADWRWVMLVAAAPAVLGIVILVMLPESPAWLLSRQARDTSGRTVSPLRELLRPPLLKYAIIGIILGTVPQMGNWGSTNWLIPWAKKVTEHVSDSSLSGWTQWSKSSGAALGSLIGGYVAGLCGRRLAYFLISAASLACSVYVFRSITPLDDSFLTWVFVQGFFGTIYFGWLPLYLPELFPTSVRATGTGLSFNGGRIATALGTVVAGALLVHFNGDFARVGQWTCLIYILGMVAICFAPDTSAGTVRVAEVPSAVRAGESAS